MSRQPREALVILIGNIFKLFTVSICVYRKEAGIGITMSKMLRCAFVFC